MHNSGVYIGAALAVLIDLVNTDFSVDLTDIIRCPKVKSSGTGLSKKLSRTV